MRKQCFPPVINPQTRVLILGSLPGDASLNQNQYYAHPRNQFWRLMSALLQADLPALPYEVRLAKLQSAGVGLWDVVADARRPGSLDSAITGAALNPLGAMAAGLPALQAIAFNGKTAHAKGAPLLGNAGVTLLCLPSSSPAATLGFDKKLAQWLQLARYIKP